MTKETRSNLIFLAIVLAILLPGAIILFRKKMSPDARRMDMPDPVPQTVAFMDPQPTPPGMRRVAPPRTMKWLATIIEERAGQGATSEFVDPDGLPLMSDEKTFQLAAVREETGAIQICVISWNPKDRDFFGGSHWSLSANNKVLEGSSKRFEEIKIPDPIRDEMGENGLLKPPKILTWRELEFHSPPSGKRLLMATGNGRNDQLAFVPSFTNPAATKKYVNFP